MLAFFVRITFCAGLLLLVALEGNPQTPQAGVPPKQSQQEIPNIAGMTNWGEIVQRGKFISIAGAETQDGTWDAEGQFRADGMILLIWTSRDTGWAGPGVYEWRDGELVGTWGYFGDVRIDESGELVGEVYEDEIFRRD